MTDTTINAHPTWMLDALHPKDMRALCQWRRLDYPDLVGVPRMDVLGVIGMKNKAWFRLLATALSATAEMEAFEYGHRN